ncbi:hypothetical protein GLOTRDRAFT_35639 [Gloeophyllum trabeum ATCC 11539]|uniref:Exonuclease domain-containing protein n=1 Tax=Gloeophyllum trabeum (strain ATCC 11539 / FP-39264 / Madison 617) TaxID=670483 RepID=S7QGU0_GLOTA|nr:uncharacterized protein GLOTRDRAFT_35639 [Gloeophyllum trabeum ATCC 11539]EPQ58448.1 hypothetical protein GLOTRDRAFT_35639 [Gloeophyllum trabeum ATCC 11539]
MPQRTPDVSSAKLAVIHESVPVLPAAEKVPVSGIVVPEPAAPTVSVQPESVRIKQPYDAFLVLDVEATCVQGSDFQWPNEIIEWPVCLMRWKDKAPDGTANQLETVAEFRSFVKPTWRPTLSQFCTDLTGITQVSKQVDKAPTFPEVMVMFSKFLSDNGLLHPDTGERLVRFCWCTDGPFDIRDFVIKQCFISKVPLPDWIIGDVMDVRKIVSRIAYHEGRKSSGKSAKTYTFPRRLSLNLTSQLRFLNLGSFVGRQHSGIDDTRNIARIVSELARRGVRLEPNTYIHADRRWQWMGKPGEILEEYLS